MNTTDLQEYLHKHIPISGAMGVRVLNATDEGVKLSALSDPTAWERFIKTLGRKNRARIRVSSVLDCHDTKVAEREGQFVALALPGRT